MRTAGHLTIFLGHAYQNKKKKQSLIIEHYKLAKFKNARFFLDRTPYIDIS